VFYVKLLFLLSKSQYIDPDSCSYSSTEACGQDEITKPQQGKISRPSILTAKVLFCRYPGNSSNPPKGKRASLPEFLKDNHNT